MTDDFNSGEEQSQKKEHAQDEHSHKDLIWLAAREIKTPNGTGPQKSTSWPPADSHPGI